MDSLFGLLQSDRWPDRRPWLVDADRTWSRGEARAAVAACVARLRAAGIGPGDRVLALLDHDVRGVLFLAAASALRLRLLMPYNLAAAAAAEWRTIAAAARPDAVVCVKRDPTGAQELGAANVVVLGDDMLTAPDGGAPAIEPPTGPGADDFLVLFTSGTTGAPKAIAVSERLVALRVESVAAHLEYTPESRVLLTGLLNNTTGVLSAFGALLHGAVLVVPPDRDVAAWPALVARERVTHMMLRPVALRRFLDAAGPGDHDGDQAVDLSSLVVMAYGAAAMPVALLDAARRRLPCRWVQGYGLSETYGPFCWLDEAGHRAGHHRGEPYCVGRPDDTLEVRLDPVPGHADGIGEVLVRGAAVMTGYLDVATGATTPPGEWLRTGDLARRGPDGDLLLQGRMAGSLLTADGHRVYPEEVEAVLAGVPGVDDVVLVGVTPAGAPAPRPVACLSGPIGHRPPDAVRAVVTHALRAALSPEKWPDLVSVTAAPFPRGDNDKVRRAEVAAAVDPGAVIALPPTPSPQLTKSAPLRPSILSSDSRGATMRQRASHSVVCHASPERVYALVRRTADWPAVVGLCRAVTVLRSDEEGELVQITAGAGDRPATWRSQRRFRPEAFGVDATIVDPMPLVEAMTTTWRVVGLDGGRSLLLLEHDYTLCSDVTGQVPGVTTPAEAAAFMADMIDANSTAELADFRAAAEAVPAGAREFHARHSTVCDADADAVYDLVRDPRHWPLIFPACVGVRHVGTDGDADIVRIEAEQDGRPVAWNTRRRYADDIRRIDYDLPVPMPLLASMRGQWRVLPLPDGGGCLLTVDRWWRVLDDVTGLVPGVSTPEEAAVFVRGWVGGNAADEMVAIKELVENDVWPQAVSRA